MSLLEDVRNLDSRVDKNTRAVERHEEQIAGKGGLQVSMEKLTNKVDDLRKALIVAGLSFLGGCALFSLGLLQATGNL